MSGFDGSLLTLTWQKSKYMWNPSGTTAEGVRSGWANGQAFLLPEPCSLRQHEWQQCDTAEPPFPNIRFSHQHRSPNCLLESNLSSRPGSLHTAKLKHPKVSVFMLQMYSYPLTYLLELLTLQVTESSNLLWLVLGSRPRIPTLQQGRHLKE